MQDISEDASVDDAEHGSGVPVGKIEQTLLSIGAALTVAMALLIVTSVIARNVFSLSFEFVNELVCYALVAIFFLSLAACQVAGSFHRVDLVRDRMSPRALLQLDVAMELVCLVFVAVCLWFLTRFELITFARGDVANTLLGTPLWIPRLVMPIGLAFLIYAIVKTIVGRIKRINRLERKTA